MLGDQQFIGDKSIDQLIDDFHSPKEPSPDVVFPSYFQLLIVFDLSYSDTNRFSQLDR